MGYVADEVADAGSLRYESLIALIWTCFGTALLFVIFRTVVRYRMMSRLAIEDYWMFLALATLATFCTLETIQMPSLYYMTAVIEQKIFPSLDLIDYTEGYLRYQFPIIILFWTTLWSVKAHFLALYFKLFRELALYRRVWYFLAGFTILSYIGCVITLTVSCGHPSNFFKFNACGSDENIWSSNFSVYYSTAVDVFTDLCIMAMPVRLIINVRITLKQKIALCCVFGLGFVMIAFAIIRAKQVLVDAYFVNLTLLMIWSTLTASIAVIVGSLPAFRLLVTNRSSKKSQYGSSGGRSRAIGGKNLRVGKPVPLSSLNSFSSVKKPGGRYPEGGDSQEKILESGDTKFVMVKRDIEITSTAREPERPHAVYQPPAPIRYGEAF